MLGITPTGGNSDLWITIAALLALFILFWWMRRRR